MRRAGLLLLGVVAACSATPTPVPASAASCAVGVSIRTQWRNESSWGHPETVYFVHLDQKGNPTTVAPVITSNGRHGRVVLLLNAKPGWYAAVASQEKADGRHRTTYFPAELIRKTLRKVEPGGFAYLGSYEVRQDRITTTADPAQQHFRPLVEPNWSQANVITRVFGRSHYFLGKEYRVLEPNDRTLAKARKHLAEAGWRFTDSGDP